MKPETIPAWKLSYAKELASAKRAQIVRLGLPEHAVTCCPPVERTLAMAAVQEPFTLLVLSGKPGTGKTVAACEWILEYLQTDANWTEAGTAIALRSRPPLLVTAARLARWDRYEQEPMAKLILAPRLAIDDLGAEYMDKNGFYASLLDEVINERYAGHRPTLLTTNLNDVEFAARYDQRIMGRIRETGRFFGCGARDLRAEKRRGMVA
jgi:DNA replication protein DnaC